MKRLPFGWGYLPRRAQNLASLPDRWWVGSRGAEHEGLWARRWWRFFRLVSPPRG